MAAVCSDESGPARHAQDGVFDLLRETWAHDLQLRENRLVSEPGAASASRTDAWVAISSPGHIDGIGRIEKWNEVARITFWISRA